MFYDNDTTVKSTYQKFYMMGTSGLEWDPMQRQKDKITDNKFNINSLGNLNLLASLLITMYAKRTPIQQKEFLCVKN